MKIKKEELWNLNDTFTEFILPRLKAFQKMQRNGYPGPLTTPKQWEVIIKKMIIGFEECVKDTKCEKFNEKKKKEGLELFAKYYDFLWD